MQSLAKGWVQQHYSFQFCLNCWVVLSACSTYVNDFNCLISQLIEKINLNNSWHGCKQTVMELKLRHVNRLALLVANYTKTLSWSSPLKSWMRHVTLIYGITGTILHFPREKIPSMRRKIWKITDNKQLSASELKLSVAASVAHAGI